MFAHKVLNAPKQAPSLEALESELAIVRAQLAPLADEYDRLCDPPTIRAMSPVERAKFNAHMMVLYYQAEPLYQREAALVNAICDEKRRRCWIDNESYPPYHNPTIRRSSRISDGRQT